MIRDSAWQAPVHIDTRADPKFAPYGKFGTSAGVPMLSVPRGYPVSDKNRICTVDDSVLADFAGRVTRDLESNVDLLIINRFKRRESEGRGCRDELAAALARDTPDLCVVRESHAHAWQAFGGDMACCIEPDLAVVRSWYQTCRSAAWAGG